MVYRYDYGNKAAFNKISLRMRIEHGDSFLNPFTDDNQTILYGFNHVQNNKKRNIYHSYTEQTTLDEYMIEPISKNEHYLLEKQEI